ncbi:MAG TPA: amino acid adenylation domain-containing protein, partial [Telluria sp.]|nr:amino acid adenylation domain-containing protein [Telluria sp.]
SPDGTRAKRYWLDRLDALPDPPALPQLPGVERRCRSRLQRRQGTLTAIQWAGFKEHASRHGLTPTSAVVSAYAEILSAWSGAQHFILSNMVTRRLPLHPEIGEMIGNFASLYPLEVDLRGGGSFAGRAQRLQQQILRDSANREWGGMQVMQALNRLKGEFGSVPCPFVVGSGLFLDTFRKADYSCLETAQTIFDHQFWELDDGSYYYVWDLLEQFFPAGMIDAMWRAFGALLERLASDAAVWQREVLDLAPAAPLAQPPQVEPRPRTDALLHAALATAARTAPRRNVLVTPRGTMSYGELDQRSDAVAAALGGKVGPDDLVALVMDRGPGLLAATLGILKAGAAYVPIDAKLPAERIAYMLENSRARCVMTDARYRDALAWPAGVEVLDVEALPPGVPAHAGTKPDDLAYVIYTSGSTGNPKGVMIEHAAAMTTIADINGRFGVTQDDLVLGVSSFSFDLSVYDVFGVLDAGATLVYPDPDAALNPAHWLELMTGQGVTVWNSAPPLMSLLAETAQRQGVVLPALRLVMLSGDWIPVDLPRQLRTIAPNARIVSLGGATEAAIWSIYYDIGEIDPAWTSIPYGRALANQGWRVLDAQGRDCPVWTTGDLYITGAGLARGYWADQAKTSASFLGEGAARRYRTGDRGRVLPDGNIEFMGRADTQVKVQGHRIELGEVESALQACPQVREAVVLAVPAGVAPGTSVPPNHPKQLVAYVVADEA